MIYVKSPIQHAYARDVNEQSVTVDGQSSVFTD